MTKLTCASCTWWKRDQTVGAVQVTWDLGECRRRAPQGDSLAKWPLTYDDAYCGDHQDGAQPW